MDLLRFEYPPVASTLVTPLSKVLLNASHISVDTQLQSWHI